MLVQVRISPKILIPNKIWVIYSDVRTLTRQLDNSWTARGEPSSSDATTCTTSSDFLANVHTLATNVVYRYHPIPIIPVILVKSWIPCLDQMEFVCLHIVTNTHTHINHHNMYIRKHMKHHVQIIYVSYVQKYSQNPPPRVCVCTYPFRSLPFWIRLASFSSQGSSTDSRSVTATWLCTAPQPLNQRRPGRRNDDLKTLITGCMCVQNNINISPCRFYCCCWCFRGACGCGGICFVPSRDTTYQQQTHGAWSIIKAIIFCSEYVFSNYI